MARQRIEERPVFENCRIIFRNFKGEQSQYNRAGDRNFCVIIEDKDTADRLASDGWNIKHLPPLDEGEEETSYLPVAVSFSNVPPTIVMLSSKGRTQLDESTVDILDYAEIDYVDLIVNPYNWEVNGKSGVKAYVKTLYVKIREDELARKYATFDTNDPSDDMPF
ncbi:MAG: hypothetical protein IKD52_11255 [Exiguobacterium sp.]|nr:hypothetical protein [Exiguobacterium sp.]